MKAAFLVTRAPSVTPASCVPQAPGPRRAPGLRAVPTTRTLACVPFTDGKNTLCHVTGLTRSKYHSIPYSQMLSVRACSWAHVTPVPTNAQGSCITAATPTPALTPRCLPQGDRAWPSGAVELVSELRCVSARPSARAVGPTGRSLGLESRVAGARLDSGIRPQAKPDPAWARAPPACWRPKETPTQPPAIRWVKIAVHRQALGTVMRATCWPDVPGRDCQECRAPAPPRPAPPRRPRPARTRQARW